MALLNSQVHARKHSPMLYFPRDVHSSQDSCAVPPEEALDAFEGDTALPYQSMLRVMYIAAATAAKLATAPTRSA